MPRLRRVDCSGPGIQRRRRGRGFEYLDHKGNRVEDPEVVARIRALAIPPAWKDVWICPDTNGHLQAVGIDDAGRKQYLYHEQWRARRDQEKFDHMLTFARALPTVRAVCDKHLIENGFGREKVLAFAVRLLERGFFRIGTEGYAEQNQTYGLATMQKRHVKLARDIITFDYKAKSGTRRVLSLNDPLLAGIAASLKRRRGGGTEFLAYKQGRAWSDVKSSDINLFIQQTTGDDFTAKDFRTWNATVLAAVAVSVSGEARSKTAQKLAISRAVKEVAHYLGNTPAVCRSSYIDPRVFDRYVTGWTIAGALDSLGDTEFGEIAQGAVEEAVLDLIEDNRKSELVEKIA